MNRTCIILVGNKIIFKVKHIENIFPFDIAGQYAELGT